MRLAIAIALVCSSAASAQVEVVRPVPRGPGQNGFTIEVPVQGAHGSFEVLRGGRIPDAPAAPEAAPAPGPVAPVQMAPVRPVEVAPVGFGRTVRVQRGPFARPAVAEPLDEPPATLPPLPPGARVIRIR